MIFKKKNNDASKDTVLDRCNNLIDSGNSNEAIKLLESYIEKNRKIGKSFTTLMDLYNDKLSTARNEKNDEEIRLYLDKIDGLMKLSKDIMRGR